MVTGPSGHSFAHHLVSTFKFKYSNLAACVSSMHS